MAIGKPKPSRRLLSTLKDKSSAIHATLLLLSGHRATAAVLLSTSHNPSSSPSPHLAGDLLLIAGRRPSAAADALLRRLHNTRDASVALKCLLTLHRLLRHQPNHHQRRRLILSDHLHHSDHDSWQLALWARWFAAQIDHSLSLPVGREIPGLPNSALVAELGALVSTVEQLAAAPESLHYQKLGIVFDAVKLAGEDYRLAMREIFARIREIDDGGRWGEFTGEELETVIGVFSRLEGCEEKMALMFLNKKRNDGVWEAVRAAKEKAGEEKRRRGELAVVVGGELTRFTGGGLTRRARGRRWLDVEWNKSLTVTTA